MFINIKSWKNKISSREFYNNKKDVLKLLDSKKNKEFLDEFSFLNQDDNLIKKKLLDVSKSFKQFKKINLDHLIFFVFLFLLYMGKMI